MWNFCGNHLLNVLLDNNVAVFGMVKWSYIIMQEMSKWNKKVFYLQKFQGSWQYFNV